MAAPMRNVFTCSILVRNAYTTVPKNFACMRTVSSDSSDNQNNGDRKPKVALSPDRRTVLCWHPEPQFPYEHTKPMPRKVEELAEGESVLKVQYLMSEKLKYREHGPTNKELANIFFTSKHQWLPKPQKKYRKVRTPKDRERL